jgi:hypothetical protein
VDGAAAAAANLESDDRDASNIETARGRVHAKISTCIETHVCCYSAMHVFYDARGMIQ